jgi:chemotaxis methyl-accepting protein methylase
MATSCLRVNTEFIRCAAAKRINQSPQRQLQRAVYRRKGEKSMNNRAAERALSFPSAFPLPGIADVLTEPLWWHEQEEAEAIVEDCLSTEVLFAHPEQLLFLAEGAAHQRPTDSRARVWSINCNSAEIYSAALVLADRSGIGGWELIASDSRAEQLQPARCGRFSLHACRHVPIHLLARYARIANLFDGGLVSIQQRVREHIYFTHTVLGELLPLFGTFDSILLGPSAFADEELEPRLAALSGMLRVGGYLLLQDLDTQGVLLPPTLDRIGGNVYQRFE